MPISAIDAFAPAFEHTERLLFQPFRLRYWFRIAIVGALSGELSSGGCNLHANFPSDVQMPTLPPELMAHQALFATLVTGVVLVGLAFFLLFLYIASRMRFILFDAVVTGECQIRESWRRHGKHGWRYFVWNLGMSLASLATVLLLVGVPLAYLWALGWLQEPKAHIAALVTTGVLCLLLVLASTAALAIVAVLAKDFVVPQMILEELTAMEGWRRLWQQIQADKGGYAGYIGMKILASIGASILFGILGIILAMALLLPMMGAGVAAVLAGHAAGLSWTVGTITLAVMAGLVALVLMIFATSMIYTPVAIFFPAYSIYFYAGRYEALARLLWPPLPQAAAPALDPLATPPPPFV
jgi:hypothetical protein